eukprot:3555381-Amphidinium_carterae.1
MRWRACHRCRPTCFMWGMPEGPFKKHAAAYYEEQSPRLGATANTSVAWRQDRGDAAHTATLRSQSFL